MGTICAGTAGAESLGIAQAAQGKRSYYGSTSASVGSGGARVVRIFSLSFSQRKYLRESFLGQT